MNKNGFTLIELLAVIALLGLLCVLTFPAISKVISSGKETTTNYQLNIILDASYDYSLKNMQVLPNKNKTSYITLAQLKDYGLIDTNIKNPETKELYPNDLVISIKNVGSTYKNSNENSKLNGDYLYTIVSNPTNDTSLKPSIELNINIPKDSEGNYFEELAINNKYVEADYTAKSSSGDDLKSNVYINVTLNDNSVKTVDTSKLGIYKIYYTVVDANGNSNTVTRTIVITDKEKPILTIPDNVTISKTATSFDLLKGVSCKDNSNVCNITTSGTIKFGVSGKYSITYIAQDSSGNTQTKERIITIE